MKIQGGGGDLQRAGGAGIYSMQTAKKKRGAADVRVGLGSQQTKMPNFCSECGAKLTPSDRACAQCGASAGPVPSAPSFNAGIAQGICVPADGAHKSQLQGPAYGTPMSSSPAIGCVSC